MKSPHKLVISAGLAGLLFAVGFQVQSLKFASVDINRVGNASDLAKKQNEVISNFQVGRRDVLQFVSTYSMISPEDTTKFKDLALKETKTAADQQQIDAIKAKGPKAEARLRELQTKTSATDAEKQEVATMVQNTQTNRNLLGRWQTEFVTDTEEKIATLNREALAKARQATAQVGTAGGYTIIFEANVAPYAVNDVTDEVLKAMNKLK